VHEKASAIAEFPSVYMITITCRTVNAKRPGICALREQGDIEVGARVRALKLARSRNLRRRSIRGR